ncbi:MAG: hypothetical protein CMG74_10560 [Candidatus Marinimicrobia bacterium]|nr:hypothetical protein [Candidatus Neomarinimicrobiota bacterium]|tara:strand:+ start:21665 stop:22291 length:627 start_codon:yes stop_codon:yes gene_type:complete
MILGIDHIAINTSDIENFGSNLLEKNYNCSFSQTIPNSIYKKPLLKTYSKLHKIAYFESLEKRFPIELTEHGNDLPFEKTPISFNKNQITIKVSDIDREIFFWANLLKVNVKQSNNIVFKSIMSNRSFDLNFEPIKKNIPYTLDTDGCTCIALITNNIEKNIDSINQTKLCSVVGPWKSEVNSKKLLIAMFKTKNGIIGELIQMERIS